MGKQTIFFATPIDLDAIFQEIYRRGAVVLNEYGAELNFKEIREIYNDCFAGELYGCNLYLTLAPLSIVFLDNKAERRIDPIKSEVIVFNPCTQQAKLLLDTSSVDMHFRRGDFVVIDDTDKYERLMADFMDHPVFRKNPAYIKGGFEHARFWFAPASYYDSESNVVKKSEGVCDLYRYLQRYIKKNYKLATNRFGYIGKDAYEHYCLGDFVPCSGTERIVFD